MPTVDRDLATDRGRAENCPVVASGPDGVGMQLVRLRTSIEALRARVHLAGGHGLEGSHLGVLFHLTTGGPMRTSQLADLLGLDPSTTSRHVAGLERTGHVERVADPDDRRAWLVQTSPSGRRAFDDTCALRNALIGRVLSDWEPAEVDAFAAALARFNDATSTIDDRTVDELAATHTPARKDRR